jgi:high affinity Mn2+ porin
VQVRRYFMSQRSSLMLFKALLAVGVATSVPVWAQTTRPSGHTEDAFDLMNVLAEHGLHDIDEESWNAYGQLTWISSLKLPFHSRSPYANANGSDMSLVPDFEHSFTGTATLYLGIRLWKDGEFYYVPEVVAERPLSQLRGIGGSIQNFELQKGGTESPQLYRARAYLQQTFGLGGGREQKTSDPMQLGAKVDRRRLVLRVGNFTILDFMDKNEFAGDPRQQFFNMAFMTYSAYDFGSDARGLSLGGVAEVITDSWSLRLGRVSPPKNPNDLNWEMRLYKYFGDQIEFEHRHELFAQAGALRVLAYHNRVVAGRFDDAIAAFQADPVDKNAAGCGSRYNYKSTNANAPDLCWARRTNNRVGIGVALEQHLTASIGVSLRAMVSDGQTEVYAYTPTDRSLAVNVLAKGDAWGRPRDVTGVGGAINWISSIHARYLALGGVDGFVGDGHLRQAPESVFEAFYSVNVLNPLWISADYQLLVNPGFNADRGPVHILGGRVHAEF